MDRTPAPAAMLLMTGLLLAGCSAAATPVEPAPGLPAPGLPAPSLPAPETGAPGCKAGDFASFIGRPAGVLAATTFPQGLAIRIIHPGDAVTMDFSASRANFLLDAQDTIRDVTCG